MAMTEAEVALTELKAFIDEHFRGRRLGFIMTVFCDHNTGYLSASAKTVSNEMAASFYNKMAMIYNGENANELPRPERMHSDKCRTAIRSRKDSNNTN